MLCSYGIFPLIIHPTRVVEDQEPSLIDNIFSNNVTDEILSGNIFLTLFEHFSQFAFIKREKVDYRKINMYSRDYSKYSAIDWRDDMSSQIWNFDSNDSNILVDDMIRKLQSCADRHAPDKKLDAK